MLRAAKQKKKAKIRCRICKANGKRTCPALLNVPICPICCKEMRSKIPDCDKRCRYFAPLLVSSKKLPNKVLPLYKCLMSKSTDTGMITAIVAQEKPNGHLRAMFLLLDFWKKGLRDCFVDADISKNEFEAKCVRKDIKLIGVEYLFEETDFEKCRQYIKHAHRISTEIGEEIPWEYEYWKDMLGDMSKVKDIGGSLYKCAKCWADLPERTVALMKQHAKSVDIQFYILCRKCGGQAEFKAGVEFDKEGVKSVPE
jgi:DNA-directed RNA polymerase subunit RPC12/RpoP